MLGALAIGVLAAGQAAAQDLPIRPTDPADILAAPDDDGGLRGTETLGAPEAPVPPLAPEGATAPGPRPLAGQGSALRAPRVGPPRLPTLAPYPTSPRPKGVAIDTIATPSVAAPVGDTATSDPAPGQITGVLRRRLPDEAPFAPVGMTIGTLRLTPYIAQSLGYDSNPEQVATGAKPSGFSRTEGGFALLSLWTANQLKAEMHGGYDAFFSDPAANRPDANGTVDYRYDVSRDIALDAEGRFVVSTQRPGSPGLSGAVEGRPLVASYGATVGGSDTFGRVTLGLHGLLDRTTYEDGRLSDGSLLALRTQDFTDYGLSLRADYAITPTLKPFAEVTLDTRVHDQRVDYTGYARDSDGILGRIGTSFELTPLITGTVSGGYENRSYADRRLRDLRGPLVDASIVYAVTPLTTLTLLASTSFDETNLAGASGAQSRSVSLAVSHALLRNVTLTGILAYLNTDYIGSAIKEDTYSATLKASYALSRSMVLEASYNHQTLRSTDPGSSFDQDVFLLGLRLQH